MRRYLFLVLLSLFVFIEAGARQENGGSSAEERNITTLEGIKMKCIGDESVPPSFLKREFIYVSRLMIGYESKDDIDWGYTDSLFLHCVIPSGERTIFSIETGADTIEIIEIEAPLPDSVMDAIDYSPLWLQDDLIDNFRQLPPDSQYIYANLILSAPSAWVDEVAYQVAHIAPEILVDTSFSPELITVNAKYLYKNDSLLLYADIIDYGSPGDEDYYSTVRYKALEDGDTVYYELPLEYYYLYIVHPELSDESPRMDSYVYNRFWRDYLFYAADIGYPVLSEKLERVKILWDVADTAQVYPAGRSFDTTDCALDVIGNWGTETVPELAMGNRPIQPNVIAYEHNGNCGETQDVLQATARAALVPAVATMDIAEDHVWCEFYYKGWHEYQLDRGHGVTHINDFRTSYDRDVTGSPGGKEVSSVWNWRSDGFGWAVSNRYSKSCTLVVHVYDCYGFPVDGARLLIHAESSQWGGGLTTIGFSNVNGRCSFSLGNRRDFYIHISSPIGDYPEGEDEIVQIISGSQEGAYYYKSFYLPDSIQVPVAKFVSPSDSANALKIDISINSQARFEHGYASARRRTLDPAPFYHTYSDKNTPGSIDFFICDEINYSIYNAGDKFESPIIGNNITDENISFITPVLGKWYITVSNEDMLTTTKSVDLSLRLYKNLSGVSDEEIARRFNMENITPNPFMKSTTIKYEIPATLKTKIGIYNISGRLIKTLVDESKSSGYYTVTWDGKDTRGRIMPSGIYFAKLVAEEYAAMKKMILIR